MELERPTTSTLIRRLRDASRAKPRSFGFATSREERPSPSMVLVAQVDGLDAAAAKRAVEAGAASVLFSLPNADVLTGGRAKEAIAACGDAAPGALVPGGALPSDAADTEFDYLLADVDGAPAALLELESIARVARVEEAAQTTGLLRALGELRIDAVVVGRPKPGNAEVGLSLLDLMHYKHAVDCFKQPVLIVADASVQARDLQAIRDLGVQGIVVPDAGRLAEFRDSIGKLRAAKPAERGSNFALLPRVSSSESAESDGEGDDED